MFYDGSPNCTNTLCPKVRGSISPLKRVYLATLICWNARLRVHRPRQLWWQLKGQDLCYTEYRGRDTRIGRLWYYPCVHGMITHLIAGYSDTNRSINGVFLVY